MKPGNLFIQGAKSVGKREMRIRYNAHRVRRCAVFYVCARKEKEKWKKDCLLLNV